MPRVVLAVTVLGALGACSSSTTSDASASATSAMEAPGPGAMSRADWGGQWPLTVDSGVVTCEQGLWVVFTSPDGNRYAVNGSAIAGSGLPRIDAIWAPDPQGVETRIDISPILDTGLALCAGSAPPSPGADSDGEPMDVSTLADGAFPDIDSLREAYVAAGGDCTGWQGSEAVDDGSTNGECSPTSLLIFFTDASATVLEAERLAASLEGLGQGALLVGPNWIINAEDVSVVADSLGGTLLAYGETG